MLVGDNGRQAMGGNKSKKPRNFDHLRTYAEGTAFDFRREQPLPAELDMRRAAEASLLASLAPRSRSRSPSRPRSPSRSRLPSRSRSPPRSPPRSLTKPQLALLVMKNIGRDATTRARIDVRTLHPPHRAGVLDIEHRAGVLRFLSNGTELLRHDVREDTLAKINRLPQILQESLHLTPRW